MVSAAVLQGSGSAWNDVSLPDEHPKKGAEIMQEPLLSGMNLTYQTLEPLHDAKNHQLFVGTITLMLPQELPLDFNVTMGNCLPQPDGTCLLEVKIRELEPDIFLETYQALGLLPAAFTHHFFHPTGTASQLRRYLRNSVMGRPGKVFH